MGWKKWDLDVDDILLFREKDYIIVEDTNQ